MKFQDSSQWEHVEYNVPVFVEHELWEVPHPMDDKSSVKIAVMPDQPRPKKGKKLYTIGKDQLEKTCAKINANLQENGKAVKVFIGHTSLGKQTEQPPLVGYGVEAKVGPFGPKNRLAIILKRIAYSDWTEGRKYPERSSEFNPLTGDLTSVALLKTEPKLPLGMMTYAGEFAGVTSRALICYESEIGTLLYGGLDMADNMGDKQSTEGPDPTAPPDAMELQGEEKNQAERYMCHYKKNDPVMRHMATQYASMQQAAQEPIPEVAAGKPHEGGKPMEGEKQKGLPGDTKEPKGSGPMDHPDKEVEEKMAAEVLSVQYAQLTQQVGTLIAAQKETASKLEALQATNVSMTQKYAMEQGKRILTELVLEGVVIKNIPKELERLSKTDDAGRVALANDMRENYAHTEQAPVGPMIGVFDEPTILSNPYAANGNGPRAGTPATPEEVDQAVMYAESHKMDVDKDWDKILQEIRKVG